MSRKNQILSIGYHIPGGKVKLIGLSSRKSLMDADIILFSPRLPYYERSSVDGGYYLGRVCYSNNDSFKLKTDIEHWQNELSNALKAGKTVFFLLDKKNDFFIYSGTSSYSGSGRNRQTTNHVVEYDNYQVLPNNVGKVTSAEGNSIIFRGIPAFQNFYDSFKEFLEFRVYLEDVPEAQIIFTGKDSSKILGASIKVGAGNLVLLPYLDYDEQEFTEVKVNDDGEEDEFWNSKAEEFGKKLVSSLIEIDSHFKGEVVKTPLPKWITSTDYSLKGEEEINRKLKKNEENIEQLKEEKSKLELDMHELVLLKDLLFENSTPLENAVIKGLKILGFQAENYDDGQLELDQVITGPEGIRCIGECEGKDRKEINVKKIRQLVDSLNADLYKDDKIERSFGILFGNPERLLEPAERTKDFTKKCKVTAKRENIALVLTKDLFKVTKYLSEENDNKFKKECRQAIYDSGGKIVVFPPIPKEKKTKKK